MDQIKEKSVQENETEVVILESKSEFGGPTITRRLLNVIPVDIEKLLQDLDSE